MNECPLKPEMVKKTENTTLVGFIKTFSLSFSKMPHESSDQTSIGQLRVQLSVATLTRSHGAAIWHTEHTWKPRPTIQPAYTPTGWKSKHGERMNETKERHMQKP